MTSIDHIEAKIGAKFNNDFKKFIEKVGNKRVRFQAVGVVFQLMDFTKTTFDDPYDSPIPIEYTFDMSQDLIMRNEEVSGTIVIPFARGTSGDRFDYLYFIQLPGQNEASPNVFYRNIDRPSWWRVKIGNDLQLFTGSYNDIYESLPNDSGQNEKNLHYEEKTRNLLIDLDIPKQISQHNEEGKEETHYFLKKQPSQNWDNLWYIQLYVDVNKYKDSNNIILIPCSTIQIGEFKFSSSVPYILKNADNNHIYSYEYDLIHNTYALNRMTILLTLKKQIEYIESLNICDKEDILELIDTYSLHSICNRTSFDVVISDYTNTSISGGHTRDKSGSH